MQAIISSTPTITQQGMVLIDPVAQFIAANSLQTIKLLVLTNIFPIGMFLICYLLIVLLGHRSQVDAWCNARPRLAGFIKIVRGLGLDPWLIWQGMILLIKARLPAYLSKLLPGSLLAVSALLLVGCASAQMVSATTSTGHQYPYCLEAIFKLDPLQADTLFCGGLSEVQRAREKKQLENPDVNYYIVPQVRRP